MRLFNSRFLRICWLVISLNVFTINADEETRNFRAIGTDLTVPGSFIEVSDDKFTGLAGWNNGFSISSSSALVEFGLNNDRHVGHTYFKTTVTYDVKLTNAAFNVQTYTGQQLEIYYDPTELSKYVDKVVASYQGYVKARIFNVSFQTRDVNGNQISNFDLNDLYVEAQVTTNKTYPFIMASTTFGANQYGSSYNSTDNELDIHWDFVPGANFYELEYTYLDDYEFNSSSFGSSVKALSDISYDFRRDATNVLTPFNFFRVPLNYERGWILYRIRPVFIDGIGARMDGGWINVSEAGNLQAVMASFPSLLYNISTGFSQAISWTSTKQFGELGKSTSGMQYVDAMGLVRQSLARLSTENKTIVQSTLYDHYARPKIDVLPTPINGLNFNYRQNLNKIIMNSSSVLFDKSIYDLCTTNNPCTSASFVLDAVGSAGAANYYSTSNSNKNSHQGFIPDAKGLPYAEVKYTPDATGRVLKQSLPGSLHHTGSLNGKAIQYFYSSPSQVELDRLFGVEAGAVSKYTKNFTIDPNGQTSTIYVDAIGRTVATALLGDEPPGVDPIPDKVSAITLTEDMAVPSMNIKDTASMCIEVNTNFFVPGTNTQETFVYSTTLGKFFPDICSSSGAGSLCLDCVYDLEISIKDACGNEYFYDDDNDPNTLPTGVKISIGAFLDPNTWKYQNNCISGEYSGIFPGTLVKSTLYEVSATPITITFPTVGNYTIKKKICVSDKSVADYTELFEAQEAMCTTSYCSVIDSIIAGINFGQSCASSLTNCEACLESITIYTNNPSNDTLTEEQLNTLVGNCKFKCPLNTCEKMKWALAYDFFPGGQFANLSNTDPNWAYSIFNVNNSLAASSGFGNSWINPPNPSGGLHFYKNNLGNDATVLINGSTYYPENLSMPEFTANFQMSWAETFIPLHPEYCKAKFFCDVAGPARDYDHNMQKFKHYSQACAAGYLKPLSFFYLYGPNCIATADPIFSVPGSMYTTLISQFINEISVNYLGSGQNIYEVISQTVYDGNVPTGHVFGGDDCTKDREWMEFLDAYLSLKEQLYEDMLAIYIQNYNPAGVGECASVLPPGYETKFSDDNSLLNDEGIDPNWTAPANQTQLTNAINNNIAYQCSTECASYVSLWDTELSNYCNGFASLNQTQKDQILSAFEQICNLGCDASHPNGSSSTASGSYLLPGTSVFCNDFQDVLDYYMLQFNAPGCSFYLISEPLPYSKSGKSPPPAATVVNDCKCDQLMKVQYDLANNINVPFGITEVWELFQDRFGYDLAEINGALCLCNEAIHQQGLAQQVPNLTWTPGFVWNSVGQNFLSSNLTTVSSKLTCNTCARCDDVKSQMDAQFSNLPNQTGYPNVYWAMKVDPANCAYIKNYLNLNNDWNFSSYEYLTLYSSCSQFADSNSYSGLMTYQANELLMYLNSMVENGLLTKTHQMKLCTDSKFFLSSLYTEELPPLVSNTYDYQVSVTSSSLTINLNKNNAIVCTFSLYLPPNTTWNDIASIYNIFCYSPPPISPGAQMGFKLSCLDQAGNNFNITGSSCFVVGYLSNSTPYVPALCPDPPAPSQYCQYMLIKDALYEAEQIYIERKESTLSNFISEYKLACLDALSETFTRVYDLQEYHYTLYYYDEAGNLQRTVPPKGVTPLNITSNTPPTNMYPLHSANNSVNSKYVSDYKFNTFGQVLTEESVDGGLTIYFYEKTGRLMASQNAKQVARSLANNTYIYSYTLYDKNGRIIESGEVESLTPLTQTIIDEPTTLPDNGAITFRKFCTNGTKTEITRVYYDEPTTNGNILAKFENTQQQHLRNRVAYTSYQDVDGTNYKHATYYSYDPHGNVTEVVQHNQDLETAYSSAASLKKLSYIYDLITGNMNQVKYQPGEPDQFMHKYYYDPDNRLHEVLTSKDGTIWDLDAKYFYYEHGPLARIERADQQVQGEDYFYTIHGWIKGINSDIMNPQNDAGKDAATGNAFNSNYNDLHAWFASDAMAYSLNYYHNGTEKDYEALNRSSYTSNGALRNPLSDYTSIASGGPFNLVNNGADLYNGNIGSMVTSFLDKDAFGNDHADNTAFPQLSAFRYDQLHRLTASETFRDISSNAWNASSGSNYDGSYAMQLSYDRNGNIDYLKRDGAGTTIKAGSALAMDELNYSYAVQGTYGSKNSNQLIYVQDLAGGAYTDDLKASSSAFGSTPNYTYDETGNLTSDRIECIASIEWTIDRKVKKITRDPALLSTNNLTRSDIEYEYNSSRQRVCKIVKPRDPATKALMPTKDWVYTYYVYDAAGNVMATYDRHCEPFVDPQQTPNLYKNELSLSEHHLYGSSRLAVNRPAVPYEWATYFVNCGGQSGECQNPALSLTTPQATSSIINRNLGYKEFELSNHLGNVISTVSDRKIQAWGNTVFSDDFSTSLNGWQNGSLSGGQLAVTANAQYFFAGKTFNTTPGKTYRVRFNVNFPLGANIQAEIYPVPGSPFLVNVTALNGTNEFAFTASASQSLLKIMLASAPTVNFTIDDVIVEEQQNYYADVLTNTDYYAFGQTMPGRTWSGNTDNYKFGFNGMETDRETSSGASNFGLRTYDCRVGRFFSRDPFTKVLPNKSPYTFAGNSPIAFIDKDGGFMVPKGFPAMYPKLNTVLWKIDAMVNDANAAGNPILQALGSAAGIDISTSQGMAQMREVLSYGSGPMLIVDNSLYSATGKTDESGFRDISISGHDVKDLENGTYTKIFKVGNHYFSGRSAKSSTKASAAAIDVFNTLMHEAGHYISRTYGGGSEQENNNLNGKGDNMDNGFESEVWKVNIYSANTFRYTIFRNNSLNVSPIGIINSTNVHKFFFPTGWKANALNYRAPQVNYLPSNNINQIPSTQQLPEIDPQIIEVPQGNVPSNRVEIPTRID